nr:hypothetical protein [Tanacetum cinerariifolium]
TKDETSRILKSFITEIENLVGKKVKIIRCDNGTKYKNRDIIEFYGSKGIKMEYISTVCYVLNRVLVTKPQNNTPYELLTGKFEEKSAEGFLVGYSLSSKAFRVYNLETKRVEENLHINFLENKPNPITAKNKANKSAGLKETNNSEGTQDSFDAGNFEIEADHAQEYYVLRLWSSYTSTVKSSKANNRDEKLNEDINSKTNVEPIPSLEDIYEVSKDGIFTSASYDDEGAVADFTNLETTMNVSPIPTSRIHSIHPTTQILRDLTSAVQTRSKVNKISEAHAFKKAIGTKWVYRNKKDKRGIIVINKARLVAQGHRQEEEIDYDEFFAPVARIKAIGIFLAFASYMGFIVYQMDAKNAFLYGKIDEDVYVTQPPGFIDPKFLNKVYKVVKALYGLHQAPRAWYATLSTFLVQSGYKRRLIDKTLFINKDKKDIMLVQVYVDDIIFGSTKKSWCDEFEALMKNRSMIGTLMYLTASRPNIMYAVCACSRFQVTLKTSHLQAVKRIFRYLKGQPKLGLWYPRESAFDLEAFLDSDYAGENLDRKFTTGEYVAAASCCGQVLWIQNQMLDYGFNFMHTKIYIDNESIICIVKNLVFQSKTKHIEIRHHFIRDAYKKKLIQKLCTAGTKVNTARLDLCCSTMFQNGYVA